MKKSFPIIIAIALALGLVLGYLLAVRSTQNLLGDISDKLQETNTSSHKVTELLNIIDRAYVDTIDIAQINEAVIITALNQLDPHSSYIPKEDLEAANEQLEGSFSGIGVQFNIQEDTIYIVDVISGGPSERAGLLPGDRITEVNDTLFVGKEINNEKVFKKLRGPKGSDVRLGIVRRGTPETLYFDITREDIPVHSVDIAYMITPSTGFIAVNSFGANTYSEFLTGLAKLKAQGMQNLIVDLRGNSGGYLDAAVNMINEFLERGELIVYVEGRAYPRYDIKATGNGSFKNIPLIVLIDEFSGSASEIFAGAMQDNDRATIIGRRSFGKGLVQQPFNFSDGSQARLTIARYYTPSGRCIQKPYTRGKAEDYETDIWNRYLHGEFFNADSIHLADSVEYLTKDGRIVYGGGGIMPDIFVPRDTSDISTYFTKLVNKALIYKFALKYTETHRAELKQYTDWQTLNKHLTSLNLFDQLVVYAEKENITGSTKDKQTSYKLINEHINSYIVRNILGDEGFYPLTYSTDETVLEAIKQIKK